MNPQVENAADHDPALLERLTEDGFVIVEQAAPPSAFAPFRDDMARCFEAAPFGRGLFYGETTKRFGRVLARSPHAEAIALNPTVLSLVEGVLGDAGGVQLNLSQAIEIHPGAPVQVPHRDQEMWPVEKNGAQFMVNVMWCLDDFGERNGATRIWPGSHRSRELILPDDQAITAAAPAGSAVVFLGGTLHSGGANRSARPRRGVIFSYCQGWLLPDENPWLAYPPDVARGFSPELAALVGYRQRYAGLNNFEGQCPSAVLQADPDEFYAFADHLSEEQNARVRAYYAAIEDREAA